MLDHSRMGEVAEWCRANEAWFVSDEIYHGITYGDAAPSALQFDGNAIVVNSFSKYFSMTGWRVGWMIAPNEIASGAGRMQSHLTSNVNNVAQAAALEAVSGSLQAVDAMREAFDRRRRTMYGRLYLRRVRTKRARLSNSGWDGDLGRGYRCCDGQRHAQSNGSLWLVLAGCRSGDERR